ncbi:MAG: type II secretion system major pseudopilin GspG [Gammaproteobacteria bacterium]|nr:type II secretion system major pseudopilin GspG [Gammaproteobacteria bacterium]
MHHIKKVVRGFTLIEIMVVVVILSILAAYVVPKIMERPGQARMARAKADLQAITGALELYKLDNFQYPTTEQGMRALVEKPTSEPVPPSWKSEGYLKKEPIDPWNRPYQYLNPGEHGEFDLFSFGRDNRPGGEGEDADVENWEKSGR